MRKQILVVTNKTECIWLDQTGKDDHYDVLTLGLNGEVNHHLNRNKLSCLGSCKFIELNAFADDIQDKLRKFIPRFIYDFPRKELRPGKSLMDLLRMRGFNLWWFMEMSEKGALRTPLIKRLYFLEIIKAVVSQNIYQEIWLELDDWVLADTLRSNKKSFPGLKVIGRSARPLKIISGKYFWVRFIVNVFGLQAVYLVRRAVLKYCGLLRKKLVPDRAVIFFTFFPFFWIRSKGKGYIENFFRSVPEKIARQAPARYAAWFSVNDLKEIMNKREEMKREIEKNDLIILESYLGPGDIIAVLLMSFAYFIKVLRYYINLRSRVKVIHEGIDISGLVREELEHSLASSEVIKCMFIMRSVRNLAVSSELSALIYRIEFQPHEKAIEYGLETRCRTVAFQHQALGRNHLQYSFLPEEIKACCSEKRTSDDLPVPDHFIVTGQYPFQVLKDSGFSEESISICGPVRYSGLVDYLKERRSKTELRKKYGLENENKIFMITTPSIREEMISLMLSLLPVAREIAPGARFLFKSHPVYKHDQEAQALIRRIFPDMRYSFLPDDVDLNDHLALCDALILTGTTVGIEAICLGTLPIQLVDSSIFCLDPLLEIKEACFRVYDQAGLNKALSSVMDSDKTDKALRYNWPAAIRKLFFNIDSDPNQSFIYVLEQKGII